MNRPAAHRPAGEASPDALGAEDKTRPLGERAEPHAVQPDQALGHGPRGRAACGERKEELRQLQPVLAPRAAPTEAMQQPDRSPARRGPRLPLAKLREWSPDISMRSNTPSSAVPRYVAPCRAGPRRLHRPPAAGPAPGATPGTAGTSALTGERAAGGVASDGWSSPHGEGKAWVSVGAASRTPGTLTQSLSQALLNCSL